MPEVTQSCKGISNPAKILRGYIEATGISDARILSERLGIPLRTIQRLKLEVASAVEDASTKHAIYGASDAPKTPNAPYMALPKTPNMAFSTPEPSRAHATKESPTEISYSSSLVDAPQANILPFAEPVSKQRGSRLPETWELPDDWRQWAEINTQLGREGIALEADKFRDFWIAQPGVKGRKANWPATWRNWCRSAGSRRPYSPGRMSYDERKPEPKINVFDQLRAEGYR